MSKLDAIYARLPVPAQHLAISAYGAYWRWLRFGPGYRASLDGYLRRDRFDRAQWQAWERRELIGLLTAAAEHVPHYRETWGPSERRAAGAGRLDALPLLEKRSVRERPESFLRGDLRPRRTFTFHTSGSTGTPVATFWTASELRSSMAVREARSARWAGVSFALPRATFSGRFVEPDPESRGPFYRYNASEKQVYFSAFHLRRDTAVAYARALRRHRIRWATGYATSLYYLAKFLNELEPGHELPPLRAVVTTSEKLTPSMREEMRRAYGCPIFEEYSSVENVAFASECASGRLHVSSDVGIVEILRPDGSACDPGEVGEVVTTGLLRSYQPFVRYRIGDLACWDPDPCPCGRALPVLGEITGRVQDTLFATDGRAVHSFYSAFWNLPGVSEAQVIQESLGRVRIRVVAGDGYEPAVGRLIIDRVRKRLGSGMDVGVEVVESIPRDRSGKFRAVVSLIGRVDPPGSEGA